MTKATFIQTLKLMAVCCAFVLSATSNSNGQGSSQNANSQNANMQDIVIRVPGIDSQKTADLVSNSFILKGVTIPFWCIKNNYLVVRINTVIQPDISKVFKKFEANKLNGEYLKDWNYSKAVDNCSDAKPY